MCYLYPSIKTSIFILGGCPKIAKVFYLSSFLYLITLKSINYKGENTGEKIKK